MPTTNHDGDYHERERLRKSVALLRSRLRKLAGKVEELRAVTQNQAQSIDAKTSLILDSIRKLFERIEGNGMRDSFDVRIERSVTKVESLREEIAELRRIVKEGQRSQSGWATLVIGSIISGAVAYAVAIATK